MSNQPGYVFTFASAPNGPTQFDPDGKIEPPIADVDRHNREVEAGELARWAERPEVAIGYFVFPLDGRHTFTPVLNSGLCPRLTDARVTTWIGTTIGTITSARVYSHNFGGRFVAITVRGTNGAKYHGRASWDNGSIIRLRRAKG